MLEQHEDLHREVYKVLNCQYYTSQHIDYKKRLEQKQNSQAGDSFIPEKG